VTGTEILLIPGIYSPEAFRRFVPKAWPEAARNWNGKVYYDDHLGQCPHEASSIKSRPSHLWIRYWEQPHGKEPRPPVSDDRGVDVGTRYSNTFDPKEPDPSQMLRDEILGELRREVDKLPATSRMIIKELYDDGREISAIAESLEESEDQVEELLAEAIEVLRHSLVAII
jgi:hypothetical protein